MDARKLLEYYYNLILFKPEYPELEKTDHLVTDEKTYVPYESIFGGESETGYELYIGKVDTEILSAQITKEIVKTPAVSYLCIIKTDKRGYYVKGSFYLSPVIFALAKMIKESNKDTSLDLNLINKANEDFNEFITIFDRKLEYKELKEIFNYVINKLNLSDIISDFETLIKERDLLESNVSDGYLMDLEYILSSRYESENIDNIKNKIKKVSKDDKEIRGNTNSSNSFEKMKPEKLKEITLPERNSLGMWPGHKNLTLKEQVILNELIKTKLNGMHFIKNIRNEDEAVRIVLEYMVSKVVDRAILMSRYTTPDEVFKEVKFNSNTEYSSNFYVADEKIQDSNTLVLAKGKEFLDKLTLATKGIIEAFGPNPYYNVEGGCHIIQTFLNNKDSLKWDKDIWRKKENGLKAQIFDEEIDYEEARRLFRTAYDKVLKRREEIVFEYKVTHGYQDLLEKVNSTSVKIEELKEKAETIKASREFRENELAKKKSELDAHENKMKEFENDMGLHKKYFNFIFKNDPQVNKYKEMDEQKAQIQRDLELCNKDLNVILNELHDLQYEIKSTEEQYNLRHGELEESSNRISFYKTKYKDGFSDEEIINKLVRDDLSLGNSIWTDEEYDTLRKKLFIEALRLHKAFINNSRFLKTDVQLFALALEGKINYGDLVKSFHDLFKAVSILSPIVYIDTDYAPYFLSSAKKESIMSAIIPEAGKIPIYETFGITERFKNIIGFNVGLTHIKTPEVPELIESNIAERILGTKEPKEYDISLGDFMSVL